MNTDACKIDNMNIPNITECASLSFVASIEDWSNIFCNRSFTLCKNDQDPNDNSDSVASSSMTN